MLPLLTQSSGVMLQEFLEHTEPDLTEGDLGA